MRAFALASLLFAACELQPAPPPTSAAPQVPVAATPSQNAPSPSAANPTPTANPSAPTPIVVTEPCIEVGNHVANVLIAGAEPAQRAIFETEKDRIVRATGEVCTTQAWSDAARSCYLKATNQPGLKECETKFPPPAQPQTRQPPPGIEVVPTPAGAPAQEGMRAEPGAPGPGSAAPTRPGAAAPTRPGAGSAAPTRPGAGAGSAAPVRPGAAAASSPARPGAGSGSATPARPARPAAGAGSGSAAPRPTGGTLMPPRNR